MVAGSQSTTSQVNAGQFEEAFRVAVVAGKDVLYLVLGFWIFPTVSARFVVSSFFWLPTTVFVAHSIWTGSYFAINAKRRRYNSLFIGVTVRSLFMLGMVVFNLTRVPLDEFFDHKGSGQALFIPLCGLVESMVYFCRTWQEKRESEDE